jgi:hypothetical protein
VFKAIAERALPYLGVAHDIPSKAMPPAIHVAAVDATEDSDAVSAPAVDAAPEAASAAPAAAPDGPAAAQVKLVTFYTHTVLAPDFKGQTLRTVAETCQRLGVRLILEGTGVARTQTPPAGTELSPGTRITVHFTP